MTDGYAAIFDMDGVLVDSYRAHYESWRRLAERNGHDFTEELFARGFGRTSREILLENWPVAVDPADVPEADRLKERFYREIITENFPAMAGARALLSELHDSGVKLAIGSSGPPENVAVVVQQLEADALFDARVTGADVTRGKPDPQVFLLAAEALGIEPGRCVVVEDAEHGVRAALAAGMTCIAITGTADREALACAGAAIVVDSLVELDADRVKNLIDA